MQEYHKADKIIHQLSQTIAKANRTYVSKEEDDSHTNLSFDAVGKILYGRWIDSSPHKKILGLNLAEWKIVWYGQKYEVQKEYSLSGKTFFQLESEIEQDLDEIGLPNSNFRSDLHFEIEQYDFYPGIIPELNSQELALWMSHRSLANQICTLVADHFQLKTEVRIWPHHFDTGVYMNISDDYGVGFGLAMNDAMVGDAYYYYAIYGMPSVNYEELKKLNYGHWLFGGSWEGAVLPLSDLETLNPIEKLKAMQLFIMQTANESLKKIEL